MIKVLGFGLATSLFLLGACGGSSPQDECNKYASTACAKLYQCVDPTTIQALFGYADQNACVTTYESTLHCATANNLCTAPKVFNSSAVDQCISDTNNQACNQVAAGSPASCNVTNFCK